MSDVGAALEALELAIARSEGLVSDLHLSEAVAVADRARARRGFLGETLVLALAGGTGSGKSSLLNAVAGRRIATTGVLRPTTDRALAWLPASPDRALVDLLDRLEVEERIEHEAFGRLALIDLPDHDSIVIQHHLIVDRLLPEVDGIVWVFDPQKYRDPVIHENYIQRLLDYADQFVFVLNQVDRVGPSDLETVKSDLLETLRRNGIADPRIFSLAADPTSGEPIGVDEFRNYLASSLDAKVTAAGKLLGDISSAGRRLAAAAGVFEGPGLDFDHRWPEVRAATVQSMLYGAGFEDAMCQLTDFVTALSVESGPDFGKKLRVEFSQDRLEKQLSGAVEAAGGQVKRGKVRGPVAGALHRFWFGADERTLEEVRGRLGKELELTLGRDLREFLWHRAVLAATLALTEVEVQAARRRF